MEKSSVDQVLPLMVVPITKEQAKPFIMDVHYAKRFPPHQYLFGLQEQGKLVGVVCYGPPASPQVMRSVFSGLWTERVLELNRLVITTSTKNAASFLVGRSLKKIVGPRVVVSYADGMMGHVGYIYQATNFLFTGSVKAHDNYYKVDGKLVHPRTLASKGITAPVVWAKENNVEVVKSCAKNRYVYFIGDGKDIAEMKHLLKWKILPYPKGESKRYDAPNQVVKEESVCPPQQPS